MESIEQVRALLRDELRSVVGSALDDMTILLERPKEREHGDLATNIAFLLSPMLKKAPRQIADDIVTNLVLPEDVVAHVEVAGPGFINFTLSPVFLRKGLVALLRQGNAFGRHSFGRGKRAQVEFVSANPTGPLTIGHGRQAVLGDVIARILENASFDVEREYYFNDAGKQMQLLGESIRAHYVHLTGGPLEVPDGGYMGSYVEDLAHAFLSSHGKLLPAPDAEVFTAFGKDETFAFIRRTLDRLEIGFDNYYSERSLYDSGRIEQTISSMRDSQLVFEQDGALWLRSTDLGLDQDWVMVRRTGEPTYRLPDIAYHLHKIERGYDLIVDVFGADHQATYPVVLAACEALGGDVSKIRILIHQFVTLKRGGREVRMSKREGVFFTLDQLLEEVGLDAVRYFYLLRVSNSHLAFDIDLALKESEENPVFYVQYGHARIAGVLRHAAERGYSVDTAGFDCSLLAEKEELALMKLLLLFPEVTNQVYQTLEPQKITVYLRDVATVFHQFYQHHRIIGDSHELSRARIALVLASKIVLARGLNLLGVSAPERM